MRGNTLLDEAREVREQWQRWLENHEAASYHTGTDFLKRLCNKADMAYEEDMTFFRILDGLVFVTTDAWKTSVIVRE